VKERNPEGQYWDRKAEGQYLENGSVLQKTDANDQAIYEFWQDDTRLKEQSSVYASQTQLHDWKQNCIPHRHIEFKGRNPEARQSGQCSWSEHIGWTYFDVLRAAQQQSSNRPPHGACTAQSKHEDAKPRSEYADNGRARILSEEQWKQSRHQRRPSH
jgi:hypothetical protein